MIRLILFSLLSFYICFSQAEDSPVLTNKRYVEIEWEKVRGATRYDLDLIDFNTKKSIKIFTSSTSVFKLNVRMGKYLFKSRIFDRYETPSDWSEIDELMISPPPLALKNQMGKPKDPIFANKRTGIGSLSLAWEPIYGIQNYKLYAESPDGSFKKEYTFNKTEVNLNMPAGEFSFKVVPILPDGNMGKDGEPSDLFTVIGAKVDPPKIITKKEKGKTRFVISTNLKQAEVFGLLEFMKLDAENWTPIQELKNLKKGDEPNLAENEPGLYRLTLYSKAPGFIDSEKLITEYLVKPIEPEFVEIPVAVSKGFGYKIEGTEEAILALEKYQKDLNRMPAADVEEESK